MWAGYRGERLLLLLVALATLTVLEPLNTQDVSRLALTRSIAERGSVQIDPFHALTLDRAFRAGHWYSDKAPGVSIAAIPTVEALRAVDGARGSGGSVPVWRRESHLWLIRLLTGGIGLLACTFLVGRAAEGIARGTGAAVAATFSLGTIAGPLGPTTFGHLPAAALAFGAFLAAVRRPRLLWLAGLLAGGAVLFDYVAGVVLAALAAYVLVRRGLRGLGAWALGAVPPLAGLAAYDAAAFGSPFHVSYRYVANSFAKQQHAGFFGIHVLTLHGAWLALFGSKGLLLVSPVLVAAAVGLVLLGRAGFGAEAGLCAAVAALYLVVDMGYFDPYGGTSPGPRFAAGALPFLAVGLATAFRRLPLVTGLLALVSVAVTTLDAATWAIENRLSLDVLPETIWSRAGVPPAAGLGLVCAAVATAAVAGGTLSVRSRPA